MPRNPFGDGQTVTVRFPTPQALRLVARPCTHPAVGRAVHRALTSQGTCSSEGDKQGEEELKGEMQRGIGVERGEQQTDKNRRHCEGENSNIASGRDTGADVNGSHKRSERKTTEKSRLHRVRYE